MTFRPTASEERWLALARRLHRSSGSPVLAEHAGAWRTANFWSRFALFILGLVAVVMIEIIGSHLWRGAATIIAGVVSLAAAEWLIIGRRHFGFGIEESLEVAGITMLAYELWSRLHASETIGFGFLGTALAIAGSRLLSPVFMTLSALAFVMALDAPPLGAGLVCYAIALLGLIASNRNYRRPSYALMFEYLVIVMPVAGYLWSASRSGLLTATDYRHATLSQWLVPTCSLAFAGIALASGLRRRTHVPIIAGMLCVACSAFELRKLTGLSLEVRLIAWGCILLLISTSLERYLWAPRRGFTSRPVREDMRSSDVLEMAGSALLTPATQQPEAMPSMEGGGGQFGGGGAGGQY
jgi:hypothetical protein